MRGTDVAEYTYEINPDLYLILDIGILNALNNQRTGGMTRRGVPLERISNVSSASSRLSDRAYIQRNISCGLDPQPLWSPIVAIDVHPAGSKIINAVRTATITIHQHLEYLYFSCENKTGVRA